MAHESDSIDSANAACSGEISSSQETPEHRYVEQVRAMLLDAIECNSMMELSDTFAWGLAIIANRCETEMEVTGLIVQQLGRHIFRVAEQERAQAEAEESRQKGEAFQ
jgi:hypothetical protein